MPTITEWVDRHEAYLPGTDEREKLSKRFLEMHDEIAYWDIDHAPILGYRVENSEDFEGVPEMKQSEITEERDLMSMSFLKICFTGGDDGTNKFHWVGLIPENTPLLPIYLFSLATANKLECEVLVLNAKPRKLKAVEKTEQLSENLFNEVYDYVVEEFDPDKDDDVDNSDLDTENEGDDQLSSDDTSDSDSETNAN